MRAAEDGLRGRARGADATGIGRAWTHGLGAWGRPGVAAALEVIRKELDTTMALCGERDIRNVGRHNVLVPSGWSREYV